MAITAMSEIVRLDDLRNPRLSAPQSAAIDATRDLVVELSEQAVLDAARARTGLAGLRSGGLPHPPPACSSTNGAPIPE